jgi:hypothetical protein
LAHERKTIVDKSNGDERAIDCRDLDTKLLQSI